MPFDTHIIGGGLAGSEAAWQLAEAGLRVRLSEMRGGGDRTPAHESDRLAEMVCSNSFRSDDAEHWTAQPGHLLADPGTRPTDRAKGQHPDVIVAGDRAYLVYFVHQSGEPEAAANPRWQRRTVLQAAELREEGGVLSVLRGPTVVRLPH